MLFRSAAGSSTSGLATVDANGIAYVTVATSATAMGSTGTLTLSLSGGQSSVATVTANPIYALTSGPDTIDASATNNAVINGSITTSAPTFSTLDSIKGGLNTTFNVIDVTTTAGNSYLSPAGAVVSGIATMNLSTNGS